MLDAEQIFKKAQLLKLRYRSSDQRWKDVKSVRNGEMNLLFPDLQNDDFERPMISNFVDVCARDVAEMIAPLPSINCSSTSMSSEAARKAADKRTTIANHYVANSRMDLQMLMGADQYATYGVCVFYIEPDFTQKIPRILIEDAIGGYVEYDRWQRVVSYTKCYFEDAEILANQFPEYYSEIIKAGRNAYTGATHKVEVIKYCDKNQLSLMMAHQHPLMLSNAPNLLGETPVVTARRSWLDNDTYKGQFDDVIWVQVARDLLAKLSLSAVEKAVQAPLAIPNDVQDISFGPNAIMRTASPDKVRRIPLELPTSAFQETGNLMGEMQQGARYPMSRMGAVDGSVITGKGINALSAGFETQISAAHQSFKQAFTEILRLCFMMDQKFWPNAEKSISGQRSGTPYDIRYIPSKDIASNFTSDVTYGFASGLDPNRAVVMLLQLRAEKAFSRDYFVRQLPFEINHTEEEAKLDVEDMRDALKQSIFGYAQALPALIQTGQDPTTVITQMTDIIKGLQKGKVIEDVVSSAMVPKPAPEESAETGLPPEAGVVGGPGGAAGGGGTGGGLAASGLLAGVAPGQAGMAPGGRPDLKVMLAGLTAGGNPNLSSTIMRRRPV